MNIRDILGQSCSWCHYLVLREQGDSDSGIRIEERSREDPGSRIALSQSNGPIAQSRLERTPDKREVVGSIPTRPTKLEIGNQRLDTRRVNFF
jgi:hypothetical protein